MLTRIFNIENHKVIPTIHCHLIPEMKLVIDKYPGKYIDMLAYAFYMTCPYKSENPYADYTIFDREDVLKKDFAILPDNPDLLRVMEKLNSLYETTTSKYLKRNKQNLEDIMEYLDSSKLTEGRDGNLSERLKIAEKCGKIMAEYTQLEKFAEEEKDQMKTRAQRKIGKGELG